MYIAYDRYDLYMSITSEKILGGGWGAKGHENERAEITRYLVNQHIHYYDIKR